MVDADTWRGLHRGEAGNAFSVEVRRGTALRGFPLVVAADLAVDVPGLEAGARRAAQPALPTGADQFDEVAVGVLDGDQKSPAAEIDGRFAQQRDLRFL